jgi:hypothetical protein
MNGVAFPELVLNPGKCGSPGEQPEIAIVRTARLARILIFLVPSNNAHHWRRASDARNATETESRRPVHEPGVRLTWA